MTTMRAVIMYRRGGPEVLVYAEVPRPEPAPHEVLIRVAAASVDQIDIFQRTGQALLSKELPHILGVDVAGDIVGMGSAVRGWALGDRVVASSEALGRKRNGGYAEYTTLPADQIYRIPAGMDDITAASIGMAWRAAWAALVDTARIGPDERVVIHAAASALGTAAVQIAARSFGARVVAIGEPSKADRLRALGAYAVIDRRTDDIVAHALAALGANGATLVLDMVGHATLQSSVAMLAQGGRIVCTGALSGDWADINVMDIIMKGATIQGSHGAITPADMTGLLARFADGTYEPVIDSVVPLREVSACHTRIERGQAFGKLILIP